ncbi:MAG: tRNA dihydrouridine(20/20a) synthase DusA [Gammaproteobacteria bacterium]|nr:MAG: tRNA dihydrouridine(20/20a) synthase DusA [Gammaproteobacteria bacterium]
MIDLHCEKNISVAPMMAWTDRHCRYLLRLTSQRVRLFTEMITTGALLHGPRDRLLAYHEDEHPVVIQLGGSEPGPMAECAKMAADHGYDEININVGCPSPRVQRGAFGACLMKEPALVAELVAAMSAATSVPVTVKCRLGVDEVDDQESLEDFVGAVTEAGCGTLYLHARKALLSGLSPAQNRQIPPLQYDRAYGIKQTFPHLNVMLNGGITDLDAAAEHLTRVDGIMIGRQAYQQPLFMNDLAVAHLGEEPVTALTVMQGYMSYMRAELDNGTRLADMTRHCLGLFTGMPGARHFRRLLSDHKRLAANDLALVGEALDQVLARAA